MAEPFKAIPEFHARVESYPLWSMMTIVLLATLCEAPRGPQDLAKFARGFSQAQRRASPPSDGRGGEIQKLDAALGTAPFTIWNPRSKAERSRRLTREWPRNATDS